MHSSSSSPPIHSFASPSLTSIGPDALSPSLTSATVYSSFTQRRRKIPRRTLPCCNMACRVACGCCVLTCPALSPLVTSFAFVSTARKLWWSWITLVQILAVRWVTQALGIFVLSCAVFVFIFSMVWSLRCSGFHRGLGLLQLIAWIPLAIYLIMRVTGIDHDNFDTSSIKGDGFLYAYVLTEVTTLLLACLLSFVDVVRWLRGRRRVFGHAAIFATRRASHGDAADTADGVHDIDRDDQLDASLGEDDEVDLYESVDATSPLGISIGAAGMRGISPASASLLSASFEWTPRSRTEHLLNRAEQTIREQEQLQQHQHQWQRHQERQLEEAAAAAAARERSLSSGESIAAVANQHSA